METQGLTSKLVKLVVLHLIWVACHQALKECLQDLLEHKMLGTKLVLLQAACQIYKDFLVSYFHHQ